MWRRRRHQDSHQACNAPTDYMAIQVVHIQRPGAVPQEEEGSGPGPPAD
eukprot:gene11233-biopygen6353